VVAVVYTERGEGGEGRRERETNDTHTYIHQTHTPTYTRHTHLNFGIFNIAFLLAHHLDRKSR